MFHGLPNIHPLLVHFPVALFVLAFGLDLALYWSESKGDRARHRRTWLEPSSLCVYLLAAMGAFAAALSGQLAANEILSEPGLEEVEGLIGQHSDWAFLTVILFLGTCALRLDQRYRTVGAGASKKRRLVGLLVAFIATLSLWQTAARGGTLVYRWGVGVEIGAHPSAEPPGP